MNDRTNCYHRYRFPLELISHAVGLYYRFCLAASTVARNEEQCIGVRLARSQPFLVAETVDLHRRKGGVSECPEGRLRLVPFLNGRSPLHRGPVWRHENCVLAVERSKCRHVGSQRGLRIRLRDCPDRRDVLLGQRPRLLSGRLTGKVASPSRSTASTVLPAFMGTSCGLYCWENAGFSDPVEGATDSDIAVACGEVPRSAS